VTLPSDRLPATPASFRKFKARFKKGRRMTSEDLAIAAQAPVAARSTAPASVCSSAT
jgi:hypothetical protein